MAVFSVPLGEQSLPKEILERDKKECQKAGPCGAGRAALYIGSRFLSRYYYIPWTQVRRVFKRVAMSQGGYSGRGVFGAMAYLVVVFGEGREKSCYFRQEADLDRLLALIAREHPEIPAHSEAAEKKLVESYRGASSDLKKIAVKVLKGDYGDTVTKLLNAVGGGNSSSGINLGDTIGNLLGGLIK